MPRPISKLVSLSALALLTLTLSSALLPGCRKPGKADGVVVDMLTGLPVDGALVKVDGTDQSTTTDKRGRFYLLDLKPGAYKLIASKGGFLSIAQVDATIVKGAVFHSPSLELISIPSTAGLYESGDPPLSVGRLAIPWKTGEDTRLFLDSAGFPQVSSLKTPLSAIFYNGETPISADSLALYPLMFMPAEGTTGADSFTNPGRWVVLPQSPTNLEIQEIAPNMKRFAGDIELGRYALKVQPASGEAAWYLFDIEKSVKPVASTQPGADPAAPATVAAPGIPKEVTTNVDSIRAAEKDYLDAFGVYVAIPAAVPRAEKELTPNPTAWKSGTAFDELGWAPEGKVAGTYWVEVKPDNSDFTVHGVILGENDKPVHYTATKAQAAAPKN